MTDPISAWFQFFVQVGVPAGLLVYVLVVYIPKRDATYATTLQSLANDFRDEMRLEREAHERENAEMRQELREIFNQLPEAAPSARAASERRSRGGNGVGGT